jgi:hypothetical protein
MGGWTNYGCPIPFLDKRRIKQGPRLIRYRSAARDQIRLSPARKRIEQVLLVSNPAGNGAQGKSHSFKEKESVKSRNFCLTLWFTRRNMSCVAPVEPVFNNHRMWTNPSDDVPVPERLIDSKAFVARNAMSCDVSQFERLADAGWSKFAQAQPSRPLKTKFGSGPGAHRSSP